MDYFLWASGKFGHQKGFFSNKRKVPKQPILFAFWNIRHHTATECISYNIYQHFSTEMALRISKKNSEIYRGLAKSPTCMLIVNRVLGQ